MGVVHRDEDLKLDRQMALKFLPRTAGEMSESVLWRFEREAPSSMDRLITHRVGHAQSELEQH